jgi:gamma-glutamyltranspeptidase/glutathione hydrolase
MKFRGSDRRCAVVIAAVLTSILTFAGTGIAQSTTTRGGMVATVQPIATDAGLAALRAGGNAVDAAVAAALTLGVVDGHNSGLGGGCFILVRAAAGEIVALDGREKAPAAATRDMYVRDGVVVPNLSTTGPLAVAVPGALAAYEQIIDRHGKLKLSALLDRAAHVAEEGFALDRHYAAKLQRTKAAIESFPASGEMLLKRDGSVYLEGDILRLPDLAKSYRSMSSHGTDWFYRGPFAEQVANWMKENGGLLTKEDFAAYSVRQREPVVTTYRGYKIVGFPPPSSGGVHVAQILNILEHFPMGELMQTDPVTAYHLVSEAMKLAFADRAYWLGDADFAKVPRGLAEKQYAVRLAKLIDKTKASEVPSHGLPADWKTNVYGKHTTHIAAADIEGNWVAITATINTTFGSKVVVPGTGILLNNEMDDFSARPGVPNAFGLVGAEANAISAGKRPLSSMSPTIVMKDSVPVLTLGGAGGPMIITEVLQAIVRFIDGEQPLDRCIGRPRLHHQWRPDRLFVEQAFDANYVQQLKDRGHNVEFLKRGGVAQAISRRSNGKFTGVSDPRVTGKAASWFGD